MTSVTGNLTLAVDQVLNTSNTILAQQASFVQQLRASQVKLQEQLFKAGSKAHGMVAQVTHGLDLLAKEISTRFAALSNQAEEQSAVVLEVSHTLALWLENTALIIFYQLEHSTIQG